MVRAKAADCAGTLLPDPPEAINGDEVNRDRFRKFGYAED